MVRGITQPDYPYLCTNIQNISESRDLPIIPALAIKPHANKMSTFSHYNERGVIRDIQSLAEIIHLDHSYAKPWSAHPDASKVRPVKTLFLPREDLENLPLADDEEIDVCEPAVPCYSANIMYDTAKAKTVMAECEKFVSTVSSKKTPDTWEEQISR